jgi:hypothetical protein
MHVVYTWICTRENVCVCFNGAPLLVVCDMTRSCSGNFNEKTFALMRKRDFIHRHLLY